MKSFLSERQSLIFLLALASCQSPSSGNSCTTQSVNCVSGVSGSFVTFGALRGGTHVQISMTTKAISGSGWMALGFSRDDQMGDDSVVDCILLNNGTIIVKNSYNVPPSNNNNINIPETNLGIDNVSTSYLNGTLQCVLTRSVNVVSNSGQVFNLTRPYYILIANGPIDDQGNKLYHDSGRYVSPNAVDVTSEFLVPRDRFYFLDNLGNAVSFSYLPDSSEMEFEFEGPINKTGRWISLGFSSDMFMGDDSVLDCLILTNGNVIVQNSYNLPNHEGNSYLNSSEGITVIKTSSSNGSLYCACRRRIGNLQNSQIFPLNTSYYLLLGVGNLNANGMKLMHDNTPVISANSVDIRMIQGNVSSTATLPNTTSPTTSDYSVFSDNHGNQVTYKVYADGNSVEFTIKGPPDQSVWWIALGFSYNQKMDDASVLDCIHTQNGTFTVQNSYNDKNRINSAVNMDGIRILETSYSGSEMSCHMTRAISSNNTRIYPFNQTYYLLLAAGPLSPSGEKLYHASRRIWSNEKANLTAYQRISSSDKTQLLRAHGCLMITAFVMLMSGAILIARYYKTCWPDNKLCGTAVWFSVHRFLMVVGLFCCAAGFIIIFCYSKGKLNRGFGDSPSYFWAHGPMGIGVMILIVMNPIIALFRCDPDHDNRWVFNWLHWLVGSCCQLLAGITLFFGIKMGEQYKLNHFSVFWILIGFVGFYAFIELILFIERDVSNRLSRRSFVVTYGMSMPGEEPSTVKEEPTSAHGSLVFRYIILAMYALMTMGVWLAMIVLIGGGFYV